MSQGKSRFQDKEIKHAIPISSSTGIICRSSLSSWIRINKSSIHSVYPNDNLILSKDGTNRNALGFMLIQLLGFGKTQACIDGPILQASTVPVG